MKPAARPGKPTARNSPHVEELPSSEASFLSCDQEGSPAQFLALLDAAVQAIIFIDGDGLIRCFNSAAERMFGYRAAEVLGRNVSLLMPEPYRSRHDEYLRRYLNTGEAHIIGIGREATAQHKDGTCFPVELSVGEVADGRGSVRFVGLLRDITDQKAIEARLRRREEALRLTFRNAPIPIVASDLDGRFLMVNAAFCDLFDIAEAQVRQLSFPDIVHADDAAEHERLQRELAWGHRESYHTTLRLELNGHLVEAALHNGVALDEQGKPMMCVAEIQDQTARLRAEREAAEHRERLAHLTRLGTVGEMTTGIAHEMNQPLAAISTYAQACERMIRAGIAEESELADTLKKIGDQARRAGEVIRRLRCMVKQRECESESEVADINELVRDLVHLARVDARAHGLEVRLELAAWLPPVEIDPIQIQQVILNLLRNAVDAMAESGMPDSIVIRTSAAERRSVEVAVIDQGPGLPDEVKARLFEPFLTTKPDGLGIGLAICRSIVEAHGGTLEFQANVPSGTIARFELPGAFSGR